MAVAKDTGRQPLRHRATVAGWLDTWLGELRRRDSVKPSTWRRYEMDCRNHVVPYIGATRLGALTPEALDALYHELDLTSGGIKRINATLGTALEAAIDAKLLDANPTRARVLRQRVTRREWVILNRAEAQRLLDAAKGDRYEALFVIAVTLGMREGEILALRWRDIDLAQRTLRVTGTVILDADKRLCIAPPKTRRARRTLGLPDVVITALRGMGRRGDGLVFTAARTGGLMRGTTVTRHHFGALLKQAGLPHMPFHDLRHTAITHMLEDGVQPHVVSEIAGHASVATTLQLYGHATRGMHAAAVEAINARYRAEVGAPPGWQETC